MVKITLQLTKSIDENAALYFEDGKKAKRKVEGVKKTISSFEKKKDDVVTTKHASAIKHLDHSKRHWFEKFKWFISSDGHLVIAGRDATTNEIIIKKHTDSDDIVFHTDMAGSPFVIIKSNTDDVKRILGDDYSPLFVPSNENLPSFNSNFSSQTILESGSFTAIHSKAWKVGLGSADVFFVKPDQVSKEANSGEFMSKGSFMIRGETKYVDTSMDFAIGLMHTSAQPMVLSGPIDAIKAHCKTFIQIEQGTDKASIVAKHVAHVFAVEESLKIGVDEIIKNLPAGGCQVKKIRKRKNK